MRQGKHQIEFSRLLSRNATGKVVKQALRDEIQEVKS
jgi:hypothetical protein